ncbi:FAS1-like dehydratase domain-containing protein [Actinocorallia longicatena]|uniref:FAS1-like dehydratase domain-containing protein n=1 Tax=Actinocorallia longicatena TaxID=111803 RepID=A0ABP6Q756_9ACTN
MSLLTPEIEAMVGREVVYTAPEELGRAAIRYFAQAVGDRNPLYTDAAHAREHGHPDVIAPPTLLCETNQFTGLPRDDHGFPGHGWDLEIPGTRLIRGGNSYAFHRPAGPSDVVTTTWRLEAVTERTAGNGAAMLVVTSVARYTDQHGTLLATNEETLIHLALDPR